MKYKVTLNNRTYEVEVEQGEAMLVDEYEAFAPAAAAPAPAPAPVITQDVSESAQKLMANAQRLYDETIAQAKEEAAAIVAKAKDSVSTELLDKKDALQKQVDDMQVNAKAYRQKVYGLMDELRSLLDAANLD